MREASVVGFLPSKAAAPLEPKIFLPVWARAAARLSRSRAFNSVRVSKVGSCEEGDAGALGGMAGSSNISGFPTGENHGAFDGILQLSDIARPLTGGESAGRGNGELRRLSVHAFRGEPDKVLRERRNVLAALAQGRIINRKHAEPVKEILAESSGLDFRGQIAVGCSHHAHVDFPGLRLADAPDLLLPQDAQPLRLHRQGQLANFIEEKRPAAGKFEAPGLVPLGTGESAPGMPKILAFKQGFWNRTAGSCRQRRRRLGRPFVDQRKRAIQTHAPGDQSMVGLDADDVL